MRNSTQDNESLNIIHIRTEVQVRGTKHAHMLIFNQFATPIEQKQAVKAYDGLMNSKVGKIGQLCVLKFNELCRQHLELMPVLAQQLTPIYASTSLENFGTQYLHQLESSYIDNGGVMGGFKNPSGSGKSIFGGDIYLTIMGQC